MNKTKPILLLSVFLLLVSSASATVLSIDEIQYDSNAEFFDGELVVVQMTADQSTETVEVLTVPEEQISENIEGDVNQDLEIGVEDVDTRQAYDLASLNLERDIKDFRAVHQEFDSQSERDDWMLSNCYDGNYHASSYYDYWSFSTVYQVHCLVEEDHLASVGNINKDRVEFEADIFVQADGETRQSSTLSTTEGDGVSDFIGDDVHVEWVGNLGTGEDTYTPTEEWVAQSNSFDDGFRIITESAFQDYDNYIELNLDDHLEDWAEGDRTGDEIETEVNSRASSTLVSGQFSPLNDASYTGPSGSWQDGTYELSFDDREIVIPQFITRVNAGENQYLSVSRPAGVPEIISVSGDRFGEYDDGEIDVLFENAGDYEGEFFVNVNECSSDFTFSDSGTTVNLDGGERAEVSFGVSFGSTITSDDELAGDCEVEVQETSRSDDFTVTESVEVVGVQEDQCTPGNRREGFEDGDTVILECQEDGLTERVVETCETGETSGFEDGELTCVPEDENGGGGSTEVLGECERMVGTPPGVETITYTDPMCYASNAVSEMTDSVSSFVSSTFQMAGLILGGVAGLYSVIFGWGMGRNKLPNQAGVTDERIRLATGITGALIGVMIGVFIYSLITNLVFQVLITLSVLGLIVTGGWVNLFRVLR